MYTASCVETLVASLKAAGKSKAEIVQQSSALCIGWPYVFAAAGEMCTPKWRRNRMGYSNEKYRQAILDNCPVLRGAGDTCAGCKWDGCRCFDCRGFTRWLLLQVGLYIHGETVTTQWETASNWAARGTIDTLPHGLVCCVFRPSHTGMYVVNDTVRHCSGTVKEEALPGKPKWERWGIPAGLYTNAELEAAGVNFDPAKNIPTLRRGNSGDEVADLQMLLSAKYGADLDIDGVFGAKTEAAVKAFQQAHGLTADGIVGPKTRAAMGLQVQDGHIADPGKMPGNIADAISGAMATPAGQTSAQSTPVVVPTEAERERSGVEGPGSNTMDPNEVITLPLSDWQSIRAGIMAAYHILQNYE